MSDISSYIRRSKDTDRDDINRLLALVSPIAFGEPEDQALKERIILSNTKRRRTLTSLTGTVDREEDFTRDRFSPQISRTCPASVSSHPLNYVTSGTIDFNCTHTTTKFGGGGMFDGSAYITIDDHADLDITEDMTIAVWCYLPAVSSGSQHIFAKTNAYQLNIQATNTIRWRTHSGGWRSGLTFTYTPNTWFSIIATYDASVGHELFKDNVSQGTDSDTGALSTSSGDVLIGDPGNELPDGAVLSMLHCTDSLVASAWRSSYHSDGHIDTATNSEVTTIPFIGDESPQVNATSNFCVSS